MAEAHSRDAEACRAWQYSYFGYHPRTWWCDPSWIVVRLARASWRNHARGNRIRARLLKQLNSIITGADIEVNSSAGEGLLVTFPLGVSLWLNAGRDLSLQPWAGSGSDMSDATGTLSVQVGDRVILDGFTGIQGEIVLGDDVAVAPGAGALKSCPPGMMMDSKQRFRLGPIEGVDRSGPVTGVAACMCEPAGLGGAIARWKCDLERLRDEARRFSKADEVPGVLSVALLNQNIALLIHRLAHAMHTKGWRVPAGFLASINRYVFKFTIPPGTCLGPGAWLPHLAGTVISGRCGANLTAFAAAWVGSADGPFGDNSHHPVIEDGVLIAGHAGVFDGARVGCGASVSRMTNLHAPLDQDKVAVSVASIMVPFEKFFPEQRDVLPFSLPPAAVVTAGDRDARIRYERLHGRLPMQSKLAVRLFRKSQRAWQDGRKRASRLWWLANAYITGANLTARSAIAPGLVVVCPAGVNFDGAAGTGLTLVGQCFVGGMLTPDRTLCDAGFTPQIGDDVVIQPHVTIYGGCMIGSGCLFEPGATIREHIAANTAVGAPDVRTLARKAK